MKYLKELGIKIEDTPYGWCENDGRDDHRIPYWKKQQEEYGFDERETWGLDYTFYLWLYNRLKMYDEVNCINTDTHKFEYKGEELTQQDCIDRMIEGCKIAITKDSFKHTDEELEKVDDVAKIWAICINSMWW